MRQDSDDVPNAQELPSLALALTDNKDRCNSALASILIIRPFHSDPKPIDVHNPRDPIEKTSPLFSAEQTVYTNNKRRLGPSGINLQRFPGTDLQRYYSVWFRCDHEHPCFWSPIGL